jgi:hypothetical protein
LIWIEEVLLGRRRHFHPVYLLVHASSSFEDGPVDFALIELTESYYLWLFQRMIEVQQSWSRDKALQSVTYWDDATIFIPNTSLVYDNPDLEEEFTGIRDNLSWGEIFFPSAQLATAFLRSNELIPGYFTSGVVQITGRTVSWLAHYNHDSGSVETTELLIHELLKVLSYLDRYDTEPIHAEKKRQTEENAARLDPQARAVETSDTPPESAICQSRCEGWQE